MKNFKGAHVCAYISLTVSSILMALWICNVGGFTVVSLDSFVGVIVALLAIIVAFAVAWNIYNGIDLKNDVKEAKTEFNKKVEEVEKVEKKLQEEIVALKKSNGHSLHLNFLQFGYTAFRSGEYANAIQYYTLSLRLALQYHSTFNVEFVLTKLEQTINEYSYISQDESEYSDCLYEFSNENIKAINDNNDKITASQGFESIRERYTNIWKRIQDLINRYKQITA
ncbi:MAG: hypothetical protein J6U08_05430 [Paludibacteraceae bacterium]|nr:hypothetical protein [Paludibacteraceae bacterium]